MTGSSATIAGSAAAADAARDWEAVRQSAQIQYAPLPPMKPPETPAWLEWLDWLLRTIFGPAAKGLVAAWPVLQYVLIALGVTLVLWLAWRLLGPLLERRSRKTGDDTWAPTREEALALLEDADRLAGEGRYGEAAHLLLKRSVGQIAEVRPDWLSPSSTSREIGASTALPAPARRAFAVIAGEVERSLFALQGLALADWQRARAAYADFALADLRLTGGAETP